MTSTDFTTVTQQLRPHIAALDEGVAQLDSSVGLVLHAAGAGRYGAMLSGLPQVYWAQHARQLDLTEFIAQNLRIAAARLTVAVDAYDEGAGDRAESAVTVGEGVTEPAETRTPVPGPRSYIGQRDLDLAPREASAVPMEAVSLLLCDPTPLIGDVDRIGAVGTTWEEIARDHDALADRLGASLEAGLESWHGPAAAQHARLCGNNVEAIRKLAHAARLLAQGMNCSAAIMSLTERWLVGVREDYEHALRTPHAQVSIPQLLRRHLAATGKITALLLALRQLMDD